MKVRRRQEPRQQWHQAVNCDQKEKGASKVNSFFAGKTDAGTKKWFFFDGDENISDAADQKEKEFPKTRPSYFVFLFCARKVIEEPWRDIKMGNKLSEKKLKKVIAKCNSSSNNNIIVGAEVKWSRKKVGSLNLFRLPEFRNGGPESITSCSAWPRPEKGPRPFHRVATEAGGRLRWDQSGKPGPDLCRHSRGSAPSSGSRRPTSAWTVCATRCRTGC